MLCLIEKILLLCFVILKLLCTYIFSFFFLLLVNRSPFMPTLYYMSYLNFLKSLQHNRLFVFNYSFIRIISYIYYRENIIPLFSKNWRGSIFHLKRLQSLSICEDNFRNLLFTIHILWYLNENLKVAKYLVIHLVHRWNKVPSMNLNLI